MVGLQLDYLSRFYHSAPLRRYRSTRLRTTTAESPQWMEMSELRPIYPRHFLREPITRRENKPRCALRQVRETRSTVDSAVTPRSASVRRGCYPLRRIDDNHVRRVKHRSDCAIRRSPDSAHYGCVTEGRHRECRRVGDGTGRVASRTDGMASVRPKHAMGRRPGRTWPAREGSRGCHGGPRVLRGC